MLPYENYTHSHMRTNIFINIRVVVSVVLERSVWIREQKGNFICDLNRMVFVKFTRKFHSMCTLLETSEVEICLLFFLIFLFLFYLSAYYNALITSFWFLLSPLLKTKTNPPSLSNRHFHVYREMRVQSEAVLPPTWPFSSDSASLVRPRGVHAAATGRTEM